MRLVTFEAEGTDRIGVLRENRIVELIDLPDGVSGLRDLLAHETIPQIARRAEPLEATWSLDEVRLRPPVTDPAKIICVGVNYRTHREETGHAKNGHPTIFTRFADTQIGHDEPALRPEVTERFDYEGELAVVIGKHAHTVSREDAWEHIAGVSIYNDFTARDWQKHSSQWTPGKNFPGTGAFGPALVTLDELGDIESLVLQTRVNAEIRQSAPLGDLIFDIPDLISYITTFTALVPGDVIVTGTPGGVGQFMDPPVFLNHGDTVEVSIDRVGLLRNVVKPEDSRDLT